MSQDYDQLLSKLTEIESASKTLEHPKYLSNYNFSENQLSHSVSVPPPVSALDQKKKMSARNIKIAIIIGITLAVLAMILVLIKWVVAPQYKAYQEKKSLLSLPPPPSPPAAEPSPPSPAPEKKQVTFAKPTPNPPHRVKITAPSPPERVLEEPVSPNTTIPEESSPAPKGTWSTAIDWEDYE
jgi:hypothetical protein